MARALEAPPHLCRYVVRQDYSQYTAIDQAVWRFVVEQTHERLLRTGHPAYARGFAASGISIDRIPRIDEISEHLEPLGFRAICVDGFIPPRVFSAFQARGVLPIAADMRTSQHLAYTPAPDIIHEAAGHAPFLAEPEFARFVRRIGEVAQKAFALPKDREVYEAIYTLSEVKENPASTPAQAERAQAALARALALPGEPSEAAKVARLYWWTVEYGLCGTPRDYTLYGAGLLSSLAESHFCHEPGVAKLPLTAACIEVDYDITRAQPQLFVAESFAQLGSVLDQVAAQLAQSRGDLEALELARRSEELATLGVDSGLGVSGTVVAIDTRAGQPRYVELTGPCAIGKGNDVLEGLPQPSRYILPLGASREPTALHGHPSTQPPSTLREGERVELAYASGLHVSGVLRGVLRADENEPRTGRVQCLVLEGARVEERSSAAPRVLLQAQGLYPLLLASHVTSVAAGAPDGYHAPTRFSEVSAPRPRRFDQAQRELIDLYERTFELYRAQGEPTLLAGFERLACELEARYPDEWLLRWNLLEGLYRAGQQGSALGARLVGELERLELRFEQREPIATGLRYLRERARS